MSGIPEVRKAIVERHACDFGSDYAPEEAVFTTGGKLALFNALQVLVEHGDEVILPVPYWVSYKDIIQYGGGKPVYLETDEAENFRITAEAVEAADYAADEGDHFEFAVESGGIGDCAGGPGAIVRLAHERGIYLILDECYVYLQYNGALVSGGSFTEAKEHVIVAGFAVEDLCDDRMESRICAGAEADYCCDEQAAEPVDLIRRPTLCRRRRLRR